MTPNDPQDTDVGPNDLQNYPVLSSDATISGASTLVSGSLNSTPGAPASGIEFFSNPTCDGSGFGEGEVYLEARPTSRRTGGAGDASFSRSC